MVSVIIPVYNCRNYICEAVESAIAQETHIEIILVDDGSKDNSIGVLWSYLRRRFDMKSAPPESLQKYRDRLFRKEKEKFETENGKEYDEKKQNVELERLGYIFREGHKRRIRLYAYRMKSNHGVAAARNEGVLLAKGKYVAFLDADDVWAKDKLVRQIEMLEETGACLCNTARALMHLDGSSANVTISTPKRITLEKLEHSNYINCSSVLVLRDVIKKYPMEHSEVHEDYLTWLKLLREYEYVVGIDEPLMYYRLSKKGKSRNKFKSAIMTYNTYKLAGYGRLRSLEMMLSYMWIGIKKYINI